MTKSDFFVWFDKHKARFNSVREAFRRMHEADRTAAINAWFDALGLCDAQDLESASKDMFETESVRMISADSHPAKLRRMAFGYRAQRQTATRHIDRQRVYSCLMCEDSGMVRVRLFGPDLARATDLYDSQEAALRCSTMVECKCDTGRSRNGVKLVKYKPTMVLSDV